MGGGDLLNLLIEKDVFEEDFARFYVAEVGVLFDFYHALSLTRTPRPHQQRWSLLLKHVTSTASFIVISNLTLVSLGYCDELSW